MHCKFLTPAILAIMAVAIPLPNELHTPEVRAPTTGSRHRWYSPLVRDLPKHVVGDGPANTQESEVNTPLTHIETVNAGSIAEQDPSIKAREPQFKVPWKNNKNVKLEERAQDYASIKARGPQFKVPWKNNKGFDPIDGEVEAE